MFASSCKAVYPLSSSLQARTDCLLKDLGISSDWLVLDWNVRYKLQHGPMCGLVALSMAAEWLGLVQASEPSLIHDSLLDADVAKLFAYAKEQSYTKQGELFFCDAFETLANTYYAPNLARTIAFPSRMELTRLIASGSLVLVPYDADYNHTPCNRDGHSAHWALLKGVMVQQRQDTECNSFRLWSSEALSTRPATLIDSEICLFSLQGKSKWTAVWTYAALQASNAQLNSRCPTKTNHEEMMVSDSLHGLKGKVLVVGSNA